MRIGADIDLVAERRWWYLPGTDGGVRSEVGVLRGPRAGVAYAVSMYFADTMLTSRLAVLDGMHLSLIHI